MIRLGSAPLMDRLGAAKPCTWEVSQLPSILCVRIPKETPFDTNFTLLPGNIAIALRSACRSAVIWRANISTKPEPFIPIVFLSLVAACVVLSFAALSMVTNFPDSSTAPQVTIPSLRSKVR